MKINSELLSIVLLFLVSYTNKNVRDMLTKTILGRAILISMVIYFADTYGVIFGIVLSFATIVLMHTFKEGIDEDNDGKYVSEEEKIKQIKEANKVEATQKEDALNRAASYNESPACETVKIGLSGPGFPLGIETEMCQSEYDRMIKEASERATIESTEEMTETATAVAEAKEKEEEEEKEDM